MEVLSQIKLLLTVMGFCLSKEASSLSKIASYLMNVLGILFVLFGAIEVSITYILQHMDDMSLVLQALYQIFGYFSVCGVFLTFVPQKFVVHEVFDQLQHMVDESKENWHFKKSPCIFNEFSSTHKIYSDCGFVFISEFGSFFFFQKILSPFSIYFITDISDGKITWHCLKKMNINLIHPSNIGSKFPTFDLYRTTERKLNILSWLPVFVLLIPLAIIAFGPLTINLIIGSISGQQLEPTTWFLPYSMM